MAKMRLYYSPSSPYARKVRVLALETKSLTVTANCSKRARR